MSGVKELCPLCKRKIPIEDIINNRCEFCNCGDVAKTKSPEKTEPITADERPVSVDQATLHRLELAKKVRDLEKADLERMEQIELLEQKIKEISAPTEVADTTGLLERVEKVENQFKGIRMRLTKLENKFKKLDVKGGKK